MSHSKKTTIHDIAEELEITASTVSRALQDHPRISKSTKETVFKMAEKLNYQPNNIASALRKGKSNIIGIIIPMADRNFFASVIRGVEDVLNNAGYRIIISQSNDSTEKEKANIKALLESQVDGILASYAKETTNFEHYEEIIKRGVQLILFDRLHEKLEDLQSGAVAIDDYLGAFKATEHLIEQGCRRIAHFSGHQNVSIYKERRRGYEEALIRNDLPIDESLILESNLRVDDGRRLAEEILTWDQIPDAIFSASDFSAAGCMEVFKNNDIKIPEDVAFVGFSNEPFTSFTELTSVDQHSEEMGRITAQIFLDHLAGGNTNHNHRQSKTILNPELIIRKSSLKQ